MQQRLLARGISALSAPGRRGLSTGAKSMRKSVSMSAAVSAEAKALPKAATLFLSRQYALDHGRDGIRSNAVNADRVRSGLLTDEMVAARSKARGLSEADYMGGNLLGREVTAADVAQAFVDLALAQKTTGSVTTVDGGNIAAALR